MTRPPAWPALPGGGRTGWAAAAVLTCAVLLAAGRGLRRRFVVADVHGQSMAPTLAPGDRVLVRRVRPELIRNGDIVVLERAALYGGWLLAPASGRWAERHWLIKRVAATAGDPVPAVVVPVAGAADVVPPGQLVVLGDNPAHSIDSRHHGWLPADRVLGVLHRRLA